MPGLPRLEPPVQEFRHLGREGDVRKALKAVLAVELDARLGGVGDDELQLRVLCQGVKGLWLQEGVYHFL